MQGEVDVLVELISKENGLADKFLEDMQGVCSPMVSRTFSITLPD